MRSQMQAIVLGLLSLLFASPLPTLVITQLSPKRATGSGDIYAHSANSVWMSATTTFMPWIRIAALVLLVVAVLALLVKGSEHTFRRPITSKPIHYLIAGLLAVLGVTMAVVNPPRVSMPTGEVENTLGRMKAGATGREEWRQAPDGAVRTPDNGSGGYTSWDQAK